MPDAPRPPELVLAANAAFEGLVQLRRSGRIDGAVEGCVLADGCLWVGESGRVRARVDAREVVIAGELTGEVRASSKIELLRTARVSADLRAPRVALAEGSYFRGRCLTGPAATPGDAESGAGEA